MNGDRDPRGISVAVATCGRPEALARCLAALADGTARPREVIVVDQAPSQQARDAVRAVVDLPARYIEQPRLGLSASRNLALAAATGPVFAVTDDDCVPARDWVAAIGAGFAREPAPAAVTGPIATLGPRPPRGHAISLRSSREPQDFSGRMLPWDAGSGANFAASRELLRALGGWDERLGAGSPGQAAEDADLLYRILRSGATIRYDPAAVVHHEWQTWERRLRTRTSYAHGVGAMCGLWLLRGDAYALRMLLAYVRLHTVRLAAAARRRDRARVAEHGRALAGLVPGLLYAARRGSS
jgi:GT2 family glycosyltransferase